MAVGRDIRPRGRCLHARDLVSSPALSGFGDGVLNEHWQIQLVFLKSAKG